MTDPYRIRSPETWVQARDDYLAGMTAEAVCGRYGLGLSAFRRRARDYGWRRADQPDPPPRLDPDEEVDLDVYDDVQLFEQVEMAYNRFVRALARGRSVEATRWRRLWHELCEQEQQISDHVFEGMTPKEIAACREAAKEPPDTEEEARLLAMPAAPPAARAEPSPRPARPENVHDVHDVHAVFSDARFPADAAPPPSRADRRRALREAP